MSRLVYTDRLYGTAMIDEPLLLDLMASRPIQRLRGVLQLGRRLARLRAGDQDPHA